MQIKNIEIFGLESSIIRSGYPMKTGEPEDLYLLEGVNDLIILNSNDINRGNKLSKTPIGSGHSNFLKGIIIQFDIRYSQYFALQLQRYNFVDIISSQSKMHKLTSVKNIKDSCNKYVIKSSIRFINWLINEVYNDKTTTYPFKFYDEEGSFSFDEANPYIINSKEECFQYIISNLPMGFELWMGVSTNYLSLKTIYHQRKHHKLYDWKEFCDWIETLPMSNLITGND